MSQEQPTPSGNQSCTFICSRDSLDGAFPSLILALNSVRQGMETSVFYTFMGINVIRKGRADKCRFVPPGVMGAIPGMSKMATWMMGRKMDQANIPCLEELLEMAQLEGVKLVACKMTLDMMELKEEDFVDGVEIMTAEEYIKKARTCDINMFT
jgi:peroxiredoxin family protein